MEFIAAGILHAFGGYTIDSLLSEPIPVFLALAEQAVAVNADQALSIQLPALRAALNGDSVSELYQLRNRGRRIRSTSKEPAYTNEQYQEALRIANERKAAKVQTVSLKDIGLEIGKEV